MADQYSSVQDILNAQYGSVGKSAEQILRDVYVNGGNSGVIEVGPGCKYTTIASAVTAAAARYAATGIRQLVVDTTGATPDNYTATIGVDVIPALIAQGNDGGTIPTFEMPADRVQLGTSGALIALTIDDGNAVLLTTGTPGSGSGNARTIGDILGATSIAKYACDRGVPLTLFAVPSWIGTTGKMTVANLDTWVRVYGHSIGSHSWNHGNVVSTIAQAQQEIRGSREYIDNLTLASLSTPDKSLGLKARAFAQPGSWDNHVLAAQIAADATSLTVTTDISLMPTTGTLKIDSEMITYTGITGSTVTGLGRAANGSTAAIHNANALVFFDGAPGYVASRHSANRHLARLIRQNYQASFAYRAQANAGRYFATRGLYSTFNTAGNAIAALKYLQHNQRVSYLWHFSDASLSAEVTAFKNAVDAIVALRDDRSTYPMTKVTPVTADVLSSGVVSPYQLSSGTLVGYPSSVFYENFQRVPVGALAASGYIGRVYFAGGTKSIVDDAGNSFLRLVSGGANSYIYLNYNLTPGRNYVLRARVQSSDKTTFLMTHAVNGDSMFEAARFYHDTDNNGFILPVSNAWTTVSKTFYEPAWSNGEGYIGLLTNWEGTLDIDSVEILPA